MTPRRVVYQEREACYQRELCQMSLRILDLSDPLPVVSESGLFGATILSALRDRTLTLYRGVANLELCRGFCDGTGGEDLRIGKPWVEAHGATMYDSRGSGKAIHIYVPKPIGAHAEAAHVKLEGQRARGRRGRTCCCRSIVAEVDNQHGNPAAATASRIGIGSAPRESRGTARGRPSLCTSVTVIGLNLAAPN
eukprot:scaffold29871_cov121-Isochrysis_galbana.AAC.4